MTAIPRRVSLVTAALLALMLGLVLSIAAQPTRAAANPPGDQLHTFANSNEKGLATRVVRLSGSPNTLIATFEHWVPGTNTNVPYVIKRSTDDGATWTTISTVEDGNPAATHPWKVKWTPSIIELQSAQGGYAAGTLVMVATVAKDALLPDSEIQLWRSTNQGVTWTWGGVITSTTSGGLWEPWLFFGGSGQLVMHYADDDEASYSQTVAQMVSTDAGATWSARTNIVADPASLNRPGMPSTVKLPDNTYRLVYELCEDAIGNPRGCPVYMKSSPDGVTWTSPGVWLKTPDGRFLTSSPNIVWAQGQGAKGQLIVSGGGVRIDQAGYPFDVNESGQTLFVSYDYGSTWWHMGTPLDPKPCPGENWSATLLPSLDGNSVRIFTPSARAGSSECGVATAKANVGALPYSANFASNDSGFVWYGGTWSVSGGTFRETSGGVNGPKALAGSTAWSNYTVAADVIPSAAGADAGVLYRVSASAVGPNETSGYYAGIGVGGGLFVGKMSAGTYTTLGSTSVTGGIVAGTAYRVSVAANGTQHTVTVSVGGVTKATLVVNDSSFLKGQIGVRNLGANAQFDNVSVTALTSATSLPYTQTFSSSAADFAPYGGAWAINAFNEYAESTTGAAGPKAIVGSSSWTNYTANAELSVSAGGDAGVLIRVGDNPRVGPDAHTGYYAGISTGGNLFLARQDNGVYTQLGASVPISGGVTAGAWYRVSLQGSGSTLTAKVTAAGTSTPVLATLTRTDSTYSSGRVGIRSYLTSAKFDNVTVN